MYEFHLGALGNQFDYESEMVNIYIYIIYKIYKLIIPLHLQFIIELEFTCDLYPLGFATSIRFRYFEGDT